MYEDGEAYLIQAEIIIQQENQSFIQNTLYHRALLPFYIKFWKLIKKKNNKHADTTIYLLFLFIFIFDNHFHCNYVFQVYTKRNFALGLCTK